jgi:hypothetical protein
MNNRVTNPARKYIVFLDSLACCLFAAAIAADFAGKSYYRNAAVSIAKAAAANQT